MKLNRKIISAMLAISLVTATAENNVMTAEAASKPSVTRQLTITEGKKKTISVKGTFIKSKSFKSTNKSIAVVNKKGVVTAVSKGKCKVKVTVKYTKNKKAKKVLKKEYVTQITVNAKKKTDPTKEPEVTQTPSGQETGAPGTEVTKDPSSNTDVSAAPPSAVPDVTPAAPSGTPAATNAPTDTPKATDIPKATTNPSVTVNPGTSGTSQNYYPIPNVPSSKNTPTPAPTQTPDTPGGDVVEDVIIDMSKVGETKFTSLQNSINFSICLPEWFDLKYFEEAEIGYELKLKADSTQSDVGGKIALAADEGTLNGWSGGVAESFNISPGNNKLTISLYNKDKEKLEGPAVGINIQLSNKDWSGNPETLESIEITGIKFAVKKDAPEPGQTTTPGPGQTTTPGPGQTTTPGPGQTTTPGPGQTATPGPGQTATPGPGQTATPGPGQTATPGPGQTTTPGPGQTATPGPGQTATPGPGQTATPGPGQTATPGSTAQEPKPGDVVQNVNIDMEKVTKNTFTANGAKIDFSSQLPKLFDLKYFKEVQVGYTLKFYDGGNTTLVTGGKFALAGTGSQLDGYGDGVALVYNISPNTNMLQIDLSGKEGPAVGINIQVFGDKAWSEESLESITITSIVFVAREGATYSAQTPTETTEPEPGDTVKNVNIDMTKVDKNKFTANGAKIDFSSQLPKLFDLKYFKEVQVKYTLKFYDGGDTTLVTGGKFALAGTGEQLDGYGDGVALVYNISPDTNMLSIDLSEKGGPAVGINIQVFGDEAWSEESLESITITGIEFVALEGATYEENVAE